MSPRDQRPRQRASWQFSRALDITGISIYLYVYGEKVRDLPMLYRPQKLFLNQQLKEKIPFSLSKDRFCSGYPMLPVSSAFFSIAYILSHAVVFEVEKNSHVLNTKVL